MSDVTVKNESKQEHANREMKADIAELNEFKDSFSEVLKDPAIIAQLQIAAAMAETAANATKGNTENASGESATYRAFAKVGRGAKRILPRDGEEGVKMLGSFAGGLLGGIRFF